MKWALAALTGILAYLAIPPRDQYLLGWVAFLPLLWAHRDVTPKRAFLLAWLAGTISNIGAFHWVYELMITHSAIPPVGAVALTIVMGIQQGLREAIWLGLSRWLALRKEWSPLLTYGVIYTAVEFLYPTVFPLHLSNTQHNCLWTSQFMDLAGPAGLSFLMMAFQMGLFLALLQKGFRPALAAVVLLGACLLYGKVRVDQVSSVMAVAEPVKVGMVENNVGVGGADRSAIERQFRLAEQLAQSEQPDLIVFPETAIKTPPPIHQLEGDTQFRNSSTRWYPYRLQSVFTRDPLSPQRGHNVPVLFGVTAVDLQREGPVPGRPALYNAAFLLDEQGVVLGKALKNKLLLFGEFIPGSHLFPWIYSKVLTKASALYPGTEVGVLPFKGHRLGVSICYEDILPTFNHELAAREPDLLINLTNDGWFGKTDEPAAHLALAKARAIELRLYMVRSTCTGISAYIDPLGRIMKTSDLENPETLVETVKYMPGGTVFGTVGPYFAWLCVLLTVLALMVARKGGRDSVASSQA